MHIHFPQTDVIGSPADGLLPWLENYTFPHEKRFAAPDYSAQVAQFFIAELLRNGVTTALAFSTSHPASVNALFTEAQRQHLRLITGKVLMGRLEQGLCTDFVHGGEHDRAGGAMRPQGRQETLRAQARHLGVGVALFGGEGVVRVGKLFTQSITCFDTITHFFAGGR
jgi:cytosine/adenosine deaminase-related metal-dependent hydrolase